MLERKARGMQGLSLEAPEHLDNGITGAFRQGEAAPVYGITNQRVTAPGKVHTNLVSTTGVQLHTDIGKGPEALQHRVVGYGGFAVLLNTHALAVHGMPPDGLINGAATREYAVAYRKIVPRYISFRQLAHQCRVGRQRLGDQQESGRILVDTVDNPGPRHLLKLRRMVQQAVHECAARVTRSRVDNQPSRFIDDQQVLILVHDVQLYGLWLRAYLALYNGLELNGFAAGNGMARAFWTALDRDRPSQ